MSDMATERERPDMPDQDSLPRVTEVAVASMILIIVGGIYMASHLPHPAPMTLPIVVLAGSAALILSSRGARSGSSAAGRSWPMP
jgi:peptidoglycan/LPS O-acetylase OafA/YrhL